MRALAAFLTLLAPATASAAEAGLPQLNPATWASQLFWLVVTFVLLYLVLSKVALPKVRVVLDEREGRLRRDLDEAQRLKTETDKAIADYEAALAAARTKAQVTADQTRARVNAESAAAKAKVEAELAEKLKAAEASIQATQARALGNVDAVATETAAVIVSRLSGSPASESDIKAAVAAVKSA